MISIMVLCRDRQLTDFAANHDTVNSGYQMHVPITLSGKKYALNKVHMLNKQVSKYVVMPFFSHNISVLSFALTGYGFVTMRTLRVFSITRSLDARLCKAQPEPLHGGEEPRTRQ